ncbi:MAG: bifunctional metallophosphatase/5'-nucleotidase [Firmicutes bacterium]|nr:bifunctional metallophosphatase/5'-nucleotidase [Bacillota bacterium]
MSGDNVIRNYGSVQPHIPVTHKSSVSPAVKSDAGAEVKPQADSFSPGETRTTENLKRPVMPAASEQAAFTREEDDSAYVSDFVKNATKPIVTEFSIFKSVRGKEGKEGNNDPNVINIIHTNDLHGKLAPKDGKSGMAYVAGKIDQLRQQDPDFILVDAGDIAYNPPYSDNNRFNPMVDIMNDIGYDVLGAGNHEFQWEAGKYGGPDGNPNKNLTDNMRELAKDLKFPVICANAVMADTGKQPDFLKPYIIKKVGNVNVGVVGVVNRKMATDAHPQVGENWKIKDQSETLKEMIPKMKAEGADVIVVLAHDNLNNNQAFIRNTPGIDVVVGAHDHQTVGTPIEVKDPTGKSVPLVEAGSHGYMVGNLRVEVDPKSKQVTKITSTLYPVLTSEVKPDPEVSAIVDKWKKG